MATIYTASGSTKSVTPKNGRDFKLEELRAIVDGYIEVIHLGNGRIMVMNEEGRLLGLLPNYKATMLLRGAIQTNDYVVGDVLVCNEKEIR